jgi:hypothetical protein
LHVEIESYGTSADVDEYVRMLRGVAVLLLQMWRPDEQPPAPDSISNMVEAIEGVD